MKTNKQTNKRTFVRTKTTTKYHPLLLLCQQQQQMNFDQLEPQLARYVACMVLGGVGDSLGYRNGKFEFDQSGVSIHQQVTALGGVARLSQRGLIVSDDTVMLIALARGIVNHERSLKPSKDLVDMFLSIAEQYVLCMTDMQNRAPGGTCIDGAKCLRPGERDGFMIPFNQKSGNGCGAAMRCVAFVSFRKFL